MPSLPSCFVLKEIEKEELIGYRRRTMLGLRDKYRGRAYLHFRGLR